MTEEPPIDIHHYTWAIRRALPKILVLALLAGFVAVLSTSLYTSKSYSASTTILAGNTLTPNQSPDATTLARSLATVNLLTGTTDVLALAASKLPNTTVDALRSAVQSTVNPEANVITIKATADTPEAAAARANAVAPALIATERRIEQRATADKLRAALREVRRLRSAGATRTEVQAAENRISSLAANAVGSAGGFQVIQAAEPPGVPSSPPPGFSGIVAFVAVVVLGMLVVLAREQVAPRVSSAKDLDTVFSAPVLTSIRLFRRVKPNTLSFLPQSLRDDFYTLASALRQNALRHDARIIFVVSAIGGEGRTTVAANLSQALSMSGASVLAVCADLRSPKLHEWVRCPQSPGLTNIVAAAGRDGKPHEASEPVLTTPSITSERATRAAISSDGKLHVLPSGDVPNDPTPLLFGDGIARMFGALRAMPYDFVIVDTPPALGFPDMRALASHADAFLTVVRAHRLTMTQAAALQDLLNAIDKENLGLVVLERKTLPASRSVSDVNRDAATGNSTAQNESDGSAQVVGSRPYGIQRT